MIVDRLLAYFGVDVDEKSFKDAQGELQELEGQMMGIITAAGAMGAAIGAAAFAMVTDFANTADATNKLGRRIGTTAETLQEYDYVAERSGVTTDLMRNSLEKLQGKVSDAANGNKDMTATLKELGLEAKAFAAMPLGDQMEAIAKGFQGLKSDGDRTRLAMKLFEEEGRGMVTVFEGGADAIAKMRAEARGFGVYSTEDAAMAEEFNDRLLDAQMSLGSIKKLVAVELLPVMTEMLVSFRDFFLENKEWIKSGIVVAFNSLTFAVKGLVVALGLLALNRIGAGIMFATTAIRTMTAAMTTARVAALALAASQVVMAFAIPAAIGAAVAAAVLIVEDIISYFRGEKSVTAVIVEEWSKAWDSADASVKSAVKSMKASLSKFFSDLIPIQDIENAWTSVKDASLRIWQQMIQDMKSALTSVLPDFAVKAFFDIGDTQAEFGNKGFTADGFSGFSGAATGTPQDSKPSYRGGITTQAIEQKPSYWDRMPVPAIEQKPSIWDRGLPSASSIPVNVNVTTQLNGTTIDQVNQSVATNARMANAATYRDTRKGVDY
ncbi:MAG: hypothetical protein ACRDBQ_21465 [Shewanella sp.]